MKTSILRSSTLKIIIPAALVVVGGGAYAGSVLTQQPMETAVVTTGDVGETIRTVGIIASERELQLRFPSTGIVSGVLVKEGDEVKRGQKLATLSSGPLAGAMTTASAQLQAAKIQMEILQSGAAPKGIDVLEAQIAAKRTEIARVEQKIRGVQSAAVTGKDQQEARRLEAEARRQEAQVKLSGEVAAAKSVIETQYGAAQLALVGVDGVLNRLDVQDALEKNDPAQAAMLHARQVSLQADLQLQASLVVDATDADTAIANLRAARVQIEKASAFAGSSSDLVSGLTLTGYFTATSQESARNTLAQQQSQIKAALSAIDLAVKDIQNAQAALTTYDAQQTTEIVDGEGEIEDAQAELVTLQAELKIAEAQLAVEKSPPSSAEIQQAAARVRQAQGELDRIGAQLQYTVLTAPVDGVIKQVMVSEGQLPPIADAAIVMEGKSKRSVLVSVPAGDVMKIATALSGSIVFDAIKDKVFPLAVNAIDTEAITIGGVDTYHKLEFTEEHEEIKVGMSGKVTITAGERSGVLVIPSRAVTEDSAGHAFVRVLVSEDEEPVIRPVATGLRGKDGMVEVMEGLEEGETVVLNPDKR